MISVAVLGISVGGPPGVDVAKRSLRPLAEQILELLPGSRLFWAALWACVPWLNAGANLLFDTGARSAVWEQSRPLVILNYVALSFAIFVTVQGGERLARRVEALKVPWPLSFREIGSTRAPIAGASATALAFGLSAFVADGWAAAVLRAVTWFVVGLALWSFLWTYAALQLGLLRLGRTRLLPESTPGDPGVELRPLGDAAFMGWWLLVAWMLPLLVTGFPDVVGLVLGLLVLLGGVSAFVSSLWRLHRQIVDVKENRLKLARRLYAEAYEPVRDEETLSALERQHSLLGAADGLEKRALGIHDWPVAEGTWAWLLGIATSVIAVACARLILRPLGF